VQKPGSYVLSLDVKRSLRLSAGALHDIFLPAGHYVYIGSALGGIAGRVARHRRLAESKTGKLHWHIDYLLVHPNVKLIDVAELAGRSECDISRRIASKKGVSAPVSRFGSSDCRSGCKAHLYRLVKKMDLPPLGGRSCIFSCLDRRTRCYSSNPGRTSSELPWVLLVRYLRR
jgi:Uri superfamily endonuclease